MSNTSQKIFIFLLILSLFLPFSGFCQESPIEPPGTVEETKNLIQSGVRTILEKMPTILKTIWQEQVLPIWQKMWNLFKNFWESYIKNFLNDFWYSFLKPKIKFVIQEIRGLLGKEVEEKKPIIEKEFQKEKEQMQEELPTVTKSFWQRFKDLIK